MRLRDFFKFEPRLTTLLIAGGVGLLYFLVSAAWIYFSDSFAASLARGQEELILIQKYKGIGFVAAMTLVITWLVYKVYHHGPVLQRALIYMRTDPVTGLANRAVAEEFLEQRLEQATKN